MSNLSVSATTTPYAGVNRTMGNCSSTTVASTSSTTTKVVSSSTTPSSSTTQNRSVMVATSSNTATLSSSTTYSYGSSASNSISKVVSSTTPSVTSSSTTPSVTSSSITPSVTSSSITPSVTSSSTTPSVTSSSTTPSVASSSTTPSVTSSNATPMQPYMEQPYGGVASETMRNILQEEYSYMLDIEEYSAHIEQEKERIEELNSLKDEDVFAGMTYEEIIQYRYENAVNKKCKALYEKYMNGIDVVEYNEKGQKKYNFLTNNIRLNESEDMINERGYACTYFHEVGHCMDDFGNIIMGISGNSKYDFYEVLKSDYEAFLNKVQEENGLTREEAYDWVSVWLDKDVDMKNGVSDILTGLSESKIAGKYGHDEYYYIKGNVEKEAFAHFFEAGMSYKPLKQMYFQEIFPNAHKVFEQIVTDELQEKLYNIIPERMIVV